MEGIMGKIEKKYELKDEIRLEKTLEKWINAATVLGNDPTSEILCPKCGEGNLKVYDITISDWDKFERMLYCTKCNAVNFILMRKK